MSLIATKRILSAGFTNFVRNIWLSVAATSVMTITLFIISTVLIIYTLTNLSIADIKDKVGISVYFNQTTTEFEILEIRDEIERIPGVKTVTFISKSVALDRFKETHQNDTLLIETINEFNESENPLPDSFAIRAHELTDYSAIVTALNADRYTPFFDRVRDNSKVIDRLFAITDTLTKLGILLTSVFIIVTIMVMFNTIRLTIYNRREEVEIMRLVGATNAYIRGPFIVEGALYALLATVITSVILSILAFFFAGSIESFLALSSDRHDIFRGLLWQIMVLNLVLSLILGVLASTIAIRRYLRI